jgi:hypothetical protein
MAIAMPAICPVDESNKNVTLASDVDVTFSA